jgi:branched-chain amino acid transport system substrate-binding protein
MLIGNSKGSQEGEQGVRAGIAGSTVQVVAVEKYESTQWDVTAQTQRLKNAGAEVIVAYALPPPAASLVKTAREVLNWDVPVIITGVDATELFIQLAGTGNSEGIVSVIFGHSVYETDNSGMQRYLQNMTKYAANAEKSNITLYGYIVGELTVEGFKRAGKNLARESLLAALEGIRNLRCSVCLAPISFGPTDHRPFEIEVYAKFVSGKWQTFGEPVNFESAN